MSSIDLLQKRLSGNVNKPFRHNLVSFHDSLANVFALTEKLEPSRRFNSLQTPSLLQSIDDMLFSWERSLYLV
jgi:hypothetical protein